MIETGPEEYRTTNQHYHTGRTPLAVPAPPQMISKHTAHLALHDRVPGANSRPYGFGSVRPRHEPDYDRRRFDTTTHSAFGGKYADSPEQRARADPASASESQQRLQSSPAGKVNADGARYGIRTGGSTDERLNLGETDPKSHTFVQRTWLGHDSHTQYVLNADVYSMERAATAARVSSNAVPGLGASAGATPSVLAPPGTKFYKPNDTLKRSTGIWNE
jgi:hypothetical protein